MICKMYPDFESKVFELAKKRKIANLQKEKDEKILKQQISSNLGVVLEEDAQLAEMSSSSLPNSSR